MMFSMLESPRKDHLNEPFHIFSYLKLHHKSKMIFDPGEPDINMPKFPWQDWKSTLYDSDLKEILPDNMPQSRGKGFIMRAMVDSDIYDYILEYCRLAD